MPVRSTLPSTPGRLDEARFREHLAGAALLDVRSEAAFAAGHLASSGNIPLAELKPRRAELPPRDVAILVVGASEEEAARAAAEIAGYGYAEVSFLGASIEVLDGGRASRDPAERLWRPSPFLDQVLPSLPRGRALDLACGTGREAVTLALAGFEVEAWDLDAEALQRAEALAARNRVAIRVVRGNLESPKVRLPRERYDLIVCFRFLHRPLFRGITRALAPGGYLVYETFRSGQERFGSPRRPQFLLEPGELQRAFADLEILRHEEPDPPGGPILSRLLARRRPADAA